MTILSVDGTAKACVAPKSEVVFQMTLADSVTLVGKGLHSGSETKVKIHPAPENTGIVFRHGLRTVAGIATNVIDTSRGTTIGFDDFRVMTIEHLMAALRGSGVDNAYVDVHGVETPALDGSAGQYVSAIQSVGLIEQEAERGCISITETICVRRKDSFILAVPADEMKITYVLDYDHPMIGSQTFYYSLNRHDFGDEVAPARTFVLYEEVAGLLDRELARGGSIENVIVVWQDKMSSPLRYADELVRHKVMDMVGDLSLVGGHLNAEILAVKSGHALNVEFAKEVLRMVENSKCNSISQAMTAN